MKLLTGYKSYKKTTSLFLNELPLNWQLVKLKYVANIYNGNSLNDDYKQLFESDNKDEIPYIATKDINVETLEINYQNGTRIPYNFENLKIAPSNSALLCIEGGSAGRKMAFTNQDVYFVNKLACFNTENKVTSKFIFYNLQGDYFQSQFSNSITGLIGGVSITNIRNFNIPLPTIEEQLAINNYLDYQTTLINDIINRKVKQIELLKEKRQAIINETITKGLNPNAKMKDSGIEWLGKIPENFRLIKIKSLLMSGKLLQQDGNHGELHPTSDDYVDDGIPFIMANNVNQGVVDLVNCKFLPIDITEKLRIGFAKQGDVLITHKGTVGRVAIVPETKTPYIMLTPQVTYYRILDDEISNEYLALIFQSDFFQTQLNILGSEGSTRSYVGLLNQKNLKLILPDYQSQLEILSVLKGKLIDLESTINSINIQINKLKEYRQSIISEAVTGKIDVRDWQPNNA